MKFQKQKRGKPKALRAVCQLLLTAMLLSCIGSTAAYAASGVDGSAQNTNVGLPSYGGGGGSATGKFVYTNEKFGGLKISYIITSTDGTKRYDPSLDKSNKMQPLFKDLNPVSLVNSPGWNGYLTDTKKLGYYAIAPIYIWNKRLYKDDWKAGEAGIKRNKSGKFSYAWEDDISKYRVTADDFKKAYEQIKGDKYGKLSKTAGSKDSGTGVGSPKEVFNRFWPNKDFNLMTYFDDEFLQFGTKRYETEEEYLDPKNLEQVQHQTAISALILKVMKNKYKNDAKIVKALDAGLEMLDMTKEEESPFKFVIMLEPMLYLYSDTNTPQITYWITPNNFAAGCLVDGNNSKKLENFPARYKPKSSSSGTGLGGKKSSSSGNSISNLSMLSMIKEMGRAANSSTRSKNKISGSYRYWLGTIYGDATLDSKSGKNRINGQIQDGATNLSDPKEKKPEALCTKIEYAGPVNNFNDTTNSLGDYVRCKGYIGGAWADGDKDYTTGKAEWYKSFAIMFPSEYTQASTPVKVSAVSSSTNLSMITESSELGEDLTPVNYNMAITQSNDEHKSQWVSLDKQIHKALKTIGDTLKTGQSASNKIEEDLLNTVKKVAVSGAKSNDKDDIEDLQHLLTILSLGLKGDGQNFDNDENVDKVRMMLLKNYLDNEGSLYSSTLAKKIDLLSTNIQKQKSSGTKFKALANTEAANSTSLVDTIVVKASQGEILNNENMDIELGDEGGLLTGVNVSANAKGLGELGKRADASAQIQATRAGVSGSFEYSSQIVSLYSGYLKFDPKYYVNNKSYASSDSEKRLKGTIKELKEEKDVEKYGSYVLPKTGLDKQTSEIQALFTDYLGDCKDFLRSSEAKSLDEGALKSRLILELKIRVLMYLDVIRDCRTGVKWESFTKSDGVNSDRVWESLDSFNSEYMPTGDKLLEETNKLLSGNTFNGILAKDSVDFIRSQVQSAATSNAGTQDKSSNTGSSSTLGANNTFTFRTQAKSGLDAGSFRSAIGMTYCQIDNSHFGKISEGEYKLMPNYTATSYNSSTSPSVEIGDINDLKRFVEAMETYAIGEESKLPESIQAEVEELPEEEQEAFRNTGYRYFGNALPYDRYDSIEEMFAYGDDGGFKDENVNRIFSKKGGRYYVSIAGLRKYRDQCSLDEDDEWETEESNSGSEDGSSEVKEGSIEEESENLDKKIARQQKIMAVYGAGNNSILRQLFNQLCALKLIKTNDEKGSVQFNG